MKKVEDVNNYIVPPVVAVLGHVDHGKTTLLDFIRKSNIASNEHGGITQKIGATQVIVKSKNKSEKERAITFIDTPGHETFIKMRSRGANIADIAILVVASDDSVKPQTIESIKQIKQSNIPFIVVVTKIDLETARIDKVKADLAKNGVQVEGFGGEIPIIGVSAKTGQGVNELLELLLLTFDMNYDQKSTDFENLKVAVIETKVDKGRGMVATGIIKSGVLVKSSILYSEDKIVAKVRAMFNDKNISVEKVFPGMPVEILGFNLIPEVGSYLKSRPEVTNKTSIPKIISSKDILPDFLKTINPDEKRKLNIILKADTAGSLEAILSSLPKQILVVANGIGEISEADVIHAKNSSAIIVGFNLSIRSSVQKLASTEQVILREYKIIYELLDELREVAEGLKEVLGGERELGAALIIAEFPFDGLKVMGVKILSGRLAKGDTIKLMRGEEEVGRTKIKSIRLGKTENTKVNEGSECGVLPEKSLDFRINDGIIAITTG